MKTKKNIMSIIAAIAAIAGMNAQAGDYTVGSGESWTVGGASKYVGIGALPGSVYTVNSGGTLTNTRNANIKYYATLNDGATYAESIETPEAYRCNLTLDPGATATFKVLATGSTDEITGLMHASFLSTVTGHADGTSTLNVVTDSSSNVEVYEFARWVTNVNFTQTADSPNLMISHGLADDTVNTIGTLDMGTTETTLFARSNLSVQTFKGQGTLSMIGDADKKLTLGGVTLERVDGSTAGSVTNSGTGVASLTNADVTYTNFKLSGGGDISAALINTQFTVADSSSGVRFLNTVTQDTLDAANKNAGFEGTATIGSLSNVQDLTIGSAADVTLTQNLLSVSKLLMQGGELTLNGGSGTLTTNALNVNDLSTLNANLTLTPGAQVSVSKGASLHLGGAMTLQGSASFTLGSDSRITQDNFVCVTNGMSDVLDANGNSITLSGSGWSKSETEDKWYISVSENYDESTKTYTYSTQTRSSGSLMLVYDRTDAGNGRLMLTPEPGTATLSLLALAGLCARRRR